MTMTTGATRSNAEMDRLAVGGDGRVEQADVLRALATVAVVCIHVAAPAVTHPEQVSATSWVVANLVDAACRWCVPMFVMLSGALLLGSSKADGPLEFYHRRFA